MLPSAGKSEHAVAPMATRVATSSPLARSGGRGDPCFLLRICDLGEGESAKNCSDHSTARCREGSHCVSSPRRDKQSSQRACCCRHRGPNDNNIIIEILLCKYANAPNAVPDRHASHSSMFRSLSQPLTVALYRMIGAWLYCRGCST